MRLHCHHHHHHCTHICVRASRDSGRSRGSWVRPPARPRPVGRCRATPHLESAAPWPWQLIIHQATTAPISRHPPPPHTHKPTQNKTNPTPTPPAARWPGRRAGLRQRPTSGRAARGTWGTRAARRRSQGLHMVGGGGVCACVRVHACMCAHDLCTREGDGAGVNEGSLVGWWEMDRTGGGGAGGQMTRHTAWCRHWPGLPPCWVHCQPLQPTLPACSASHILPPPPKKRNTYAQAHVQPHAHDAGARGREGARGWLQWRPLPPPPHPHASHTHARAPARASRPKAGGQGRRPGVPVPMPVAKGAMPLTSR